MKPRRNSKTHGVTHPEDAGATQPLRLMAYRIPFNRATLVGRELELVQEAAESGHLSGDGSFARRCELMLEEALGADRALMTSSCTHALELAALLLEIEAGDEVIVPSFTFVSTAAAFALRGAKIVFADIHPTTLNIDERDLPELAGDRTRVIVPVHYAGVGCEMEPIVDLATQRNLAIVEDNAHGLHASYRGQRLGTFGVLAAQSFHETKNFTCGEGGALLVNDPALVYRAEVIREKGTNRKAFFRGEVDKYTWVDLGSSYLLSELQAAFLLAQLEQREAIEQARRRLWWAYHEGLSGWAEETGTRLPVVPDHCDQPYHMFYLLLPSLEARSELIEHLKQRSILAVFHYLPLHLSRMGERFGAKRGQCPVTEDISDRILRLPFYTGLTSSDQAEVIEAVTEFRRA
jgi:dTDP-4-amino-4,6-dideoxygalactose transaminase